MGGLEVLTPPSPIPNSDAAEAETPIPIRLVERLGITGIPRAAAAIEEAIEPRRDWLKSTRDSDRDVLALDNRVSGREDGGDEQSNCDGAKEGRREVSEAGVFETDFFRDSREALLAIDERWRFRLRVDDGSDEELISDWVDLPLRRLLIFSPRASAMT